MCNVFYDIETTGLNSMSDRIISIAMIREGQSYVFLDENESQILKQFWMNIFDKDTLIGFNSINFDFPFLIKRSLINNVRLKIDLEHIDLRREVNSFLMNYDKYAKGKLSDWAKVLGIEVSTENGSQMPIRWEQKEFEYIRKHNLEDVQITKQLFERCVGIGLLK